MGFDTIADDRPSTAPLILLVIGIASDYLAAMLMPRPSRPKILWEDIKAVLGAKGPHRLLFAAMAMIMPVLAFGIFYFSPVKVPYQPPDVIFVEQWSANRSDAEIAAQQAIDAPKERQARAEQKEHEESRKRALRTLAKTLGMNVDEK